jgi:hypothetical protein
MSLAQLGRFAGAAEYDAERIRLAGPTQHAHAYTVVQAHRAAGMLYLLKGAWATARPPIEHAIAVVRTANLGLFLPDVIAASAWVLAQLGEANEALNRIREEVLVIPVTPPAAQHGSDVPVDRLDGAEGDFRLPGLTPWSC